MIPETDVEKYIVEYPTEAEPRPDISVHAGLAPWLKPPKKKLTRFGKLAQWMKTPDEWAAPNTCMNYLEGIRLGFKLDPELALGYLTALEIWALAQVQKAGWRLREGTFWAWLPIIEEKIHKHLIQAPGGPSQRTLDRMEDDPQLWAGRKHKYRYRRVNYGKKLRTQLQRVYEKDLSEQGKNNFIKREAARLYDKHGAWERLLSVCGMPAEYICYQDVLAPNEQCLAIMMKPENRAADPEDTFGPPKDKTNINAFYDEFLINLLFDDKKTDLEIADAMGISVRSVLNLRQESKSKKVLDDVEDRCVTMDMNKAEALSMWLDWRLKQMRKDAHLAALHAAEPARRK
jgi:hypothetical protein